MVINSIRRVLSSQSFIQFAYLFGSVASGQTHPLSDYDIAVFIDRKKAPPSPYGIDSYISALFVGVLPTDKIQIVVLNEASPFLAYEVVSKGILVFKMDDLVHHNYVFRTYKYYIDLKRLYDHQQQALLDRIKNGTYGGNAYA